MVTYKEQQQLIEAAKQGDSVALETIADSYKGLIRSIVNRFYIVGGDKDDLLQEAMLGLFNAVIGYDETKGAFPSFVKTCVLRRVLSVVRKVNGDKYKPLVNYVELSEADSIAESPTDNPLTVLLEKEYAQRVEDAMDSLLTSAEKQVLQMFLDGYGYEDICKQLNKSYKSVDGALQRARKKLLQLKEQ